LKNFLADESVLTLGSVIRNRRGEKLLLAGLLTLTAILALIGIAIAFLIPYYGLARIHPWLPVIAGVITVVAAIGVLAAFILLLVATVLGRDVPYSRKLRSLVIKVLLPILVQIAKLVGIPREQVQHAFVEVNNELVLARLNHGAPPDRVLVLLPHCLQHSECTVKITYRVDNCKRCGKCPIKSLLELAERHRVDLAVATGGTIARRLVVEKRPQLIVAVACERDLTSGIRDTTPLPVYGIFNRRPFGPCLNTQVDINRIEDLLKHFKPAPGKAP